jgi:hypothetical protein
MVSGSSCVGRAKNRMPSEPLGLLTVRTVRNSVAYPLRAGAWSANAVAWSQIVPIAADTGKHQRQEANRTQQIAQRRESPDEENRPTKRIARRRESPDEEISKAAATVAAAPGNGRT